MRGQHDAEERRRHIEQATEIAAWLEKQLVASGMDKRKNAFGAHAAQLLQI